MLNGSNLPAITHPTLERPRTAPSGSSAGGLMPAQRPCSHRPPEPQVSYTKHSLWPVLLTRGTWSLLAMERSTRCPPTPPTQMPGLRPHSNFSGQGCHEYSFGGRGQYGPGMVSPRAAGEKVDGRVSMQTASQMPRRDQLPSSMSSTMRALMGPPLIQPETMPNRPTSSQWWMGRKNLVSPGRLPLKRPSRLTCVRPADGS